MAEAEYKRLVKLSYEEETKIQTKHSDLKNYEAKLSSIKGNMVGATTDFNNLCETIEKLSVEKKNLQGEVDNLKSQVSQQTTIIEEENNKIDERKKVLMESEKEFEIRNKTLTESVARHESKVERLKQAIG